MIYGSALLRGLKLTYPSQSVPVASVKNATVILPSASTGMMFEWNVQEGSLGTHKLGDKFFTTLSASYGDTTISDYAIAAGALPASLTLDHDTAIVSGPLTVSGQFGFTIRAAVDSTSSDASYSVTVQP